MARTTTATTKKVAFIPAKPLEVVKGIPEGAKKRVCAYCRVSTDMKEQETSFESQVRYYTEYISNRNDWEFVDVYADEGITGTSIQKRTGFKKMIDDCMAGKIDKVICKSVSRFARNTEDCLHYVRQLKDKGISVYFETENIDTLGTGGELLLTILSGLAQDSSRNQSDVTRWGYQRQFESGRVIVNTTRFLGYDKNKDGELIINEKEAEIVCRVFREYLEGKSYNAIAKRLTKDGIKTITGGDKWYDSTIKGMLENEKYCGNVLLQKTITVDFLKHKRVDNKGQAPQYFIEDNHPAIISKEIFEQVQAERNRRALIKGNPVDGNRNRYSSKYPFSGKVFCANCGNVFKRRHWNSNNSSRKVVWQCKSYIVNGKNACDAKAVPEQALIDIFLQMFEGIYENRQSFIKTLNENIEKVVLEKPKVEEIEVLDEQIEELKDELKKLIRFQTNNNIDSEVYSEEYKRLSDELETVRKKRLEYKTVNELKDKMKQRLDEIIKIINSRNSPLDEFDEQIFNALVERIEVISPTRFIFELKNGVRFIEDEW